MVGDPISDMLIRIKNAGYSKKPSVSIPYSNLKFEIAKGLLSEGFVKSIDKKGRKTKRNVLVELSYKESEAPKIEDVSRISKPSRRIYRNTKELVRFTKKRGSVFVSTSKGIITARNAVKTKIGGEVLFRIW